MSATDTITLEELAAAFRDGWPSSPSANAAVAAEQVYAHAVRNREPEYERGHFYEDALGRVFSRLLGDGEGWSSAPEGAHYPHDYPRRPLRKLVPEPAAPFSHDAVVNILAAGGAHTAEWLGRKADEICNLAEGKGSPWA